MDLKWQSVICLVLMTCVSSITANCNYYRGNLTCTNINTTTYLAARQQYANSVMYILDITDSSLETLMTGMFDSNSPAWQSIHTIKITNSLINTIQANAFSYLDANRYLPLRELAVINLSRNNVHVFNSNVFNSPVLYTLVLDYNAITAIESGTVMKNLKFLSLSHNNLYRISSDILSGLTNLTHLDVSSNPNLEVTMGTFLKLQQLTNLSIANLNQTFQYGTFTGLSNLIQLNVSSNQVHPNYLTALTKLNNLDFDNNPLGSFLNLLELPAFFPYLKRVSINNVVVDTCENMSRIVGYFQQKGINVNLNPPKTTVSPNINGIACQLE